MSVFKKRYKNKGGKTSEYWYIDYTVDGKRKWESVGKVGLVNKTDARKLLSIRKVEVLKGIFGIDKKRTSPSFSMFSKEYIVYAKSNKKSWDRDVCALRSLEPFFGRYELDKISPIQIEKYKVERKATVSPRTVNIELSLLRRMFNLGITWDKCESNPVSKVKFYREDPPTERVLSEDEEQRLLECSAEHIKPIIATALNTGLRYGELINLRWQDIDFEGRYIVVRTSKTGNSRKVPMNDTVKETLEQLFLRSTVSDSVSSKVYAGDKSEQSQALRYGNALDSKAVGLTLVRVRVPLCPKIQQNYFCYFCFNTGISWSYLICI